MKIITTLSKVKILHNIKINYKVYHFNYALSNTLIHYKKKKKLIQINLMSKLLCSKSKQIFLILYPIFERYPILVNNYNFLTLV